MNDTDQRGTLKIGEPHPAAHSALRYIQELGPEQHSILLESLSSCAVEGNRLAEICAETLHRMMAGEPVSDRYVLGLAWMVRDMEDEK